VAPPPIQPRHVRVAAPKRRPHPRHVVAVHRKSAPERFTLPAILSHGLNLLPPVFTAPFNTLSHGDPVMMLLGALALAVLVLASLRLLKLLARAGHEGWERPGS
jgi:hypothetical protein